MDGCCSGRSRHRSRGVRAIPDALAGADWSSVLESWVTILDAVFVATLAILFNISGSELVLDRDLDTNQEPVTRLS